jgi:hypothetical protein
MKKTEGRKSRDTVPLTGRKVDFPGASASATGPAVVRHLK